MATLQPCIFIGKWLRDIVKKKDIDIHVNRISFMAQNFRPDEYKKKVAEYVKKYATEEALRASGDQVRRL